MRISTSLTILFLFFGALLQAATPYEVEYHGVKKQSLISLMESVSELEELKDHPPATFSALKRRAEEDIPRLLKALHFFAYYDAEIDVEIERQDNKALVHFHIRQGPRYKLDKFNIKYSDNETQTIKNKDIGVNSGKSVSTAKVLDAQNNIVVILQERGYPFAKILNSQVVVDQANKRVNVDVEVSTGPFATFGETTIDGLIKIKRSFVSKKVAWKMGDAFDPRLIKETRKALEGSLLFKGIEIKPGEINEGGELPFSIKLTESKHRSIGAGISYSTHKGPGFIGEWEHRNIRGIGEKLSFDTDITEKIQKGTLTYRKPDFLRRKQDLIWFLETEHETAKTFKTQANNVGFRIERNINPHVDIFAGLRLEGLRTTRSDNDRHNTLLSLPTLFQWNVTNSRVNPTRGADLKLRVTPYTDLQNSSLTFVVNRFNTSLYIPMDEEHNVTLAASANFGTISGASRIEIPPSNRFYAGSENLLRGYSYRSVSPLDAGGSPIGGRSLMVFGIEPRFKLKNQFMLATFFEAGNVYTDTLPRLEKRLLKSLGLGLRYMTPIGPIRLDIAFPLDRRKDLDKAYQLYISIGHSF